MSRNIKNNENEILNLLAIAIVDNPRSTIQELADNIGVSKATLHRFCGTRENLQTMLVDRSIEVMNQIAEFAQNCNDDFKVALRSIINMHLADKDILRFSCCAFCMDKDFCSPYLNAMDSFFLKGQKEGVFKLEISANILSELFSSIICSMIDARKRGRIGFVGLADTIENFFLYGSLDKIK